MTLFRFVQNLILSVLLCLLFVSSASAFVALLPEAGFVELEPIEYTLNVSPTSGTHKKTLQSNIFYSFFPADDDPEEKPLFVMLNGGPGAATTVNLFSMNTAPYTLDMERICGKGVKKCNKGYVKNKHSWTSVGNLMYIDAPATGFSYLVANHNMAQRHLDFLSGANFNPFIDADQIVRVILRFLARHKKIQANEVILVGESYGGTRVSTMLNLLLFSQRYGKDGTGVFRDQSLVDEIAAHFAAVAEHGQQGKGGDSNSTRPIDTNSTDFLGLQPLTPERVAEQFGKQVLIQPSLSGKYQDEVQGNMYYDEAPYQDKVIKNLAKETHSTFPGLYYLRSWWGQLVCADYSLLLSSKSSCVVAYHAPYHFKRDPYNDMERASWSDDLAAFATRSLRNYDVLKTILKFDPKDIPQMQPSARKNAFKRLGYFKKTASFQLKNNQRSATTQNDSLPMETEEPMDAKALKAEEAKARLEFKTKGMARLKEELTESLGREMANAFLHMKEPVSSRFSARFEASKKINELESKFGKLPGKTMEQALGRLNRCDTYMNPWSEQIYLAFVLSKDVLLYGLNADSSPRYGEMFLENVQLVDTFLTDAQHDLVIYSPAIPEALKKHKKVVRTVHCKRATSHSPGNFTIVYKNGVYKDSLAAPKQQVDLYYPHYASSGHSVSSTQPEKLLNDVKSWLWLSQKTN